MVYDVTNPTAPVFEDYQNTRSNTALTGDLGPEGIQYISNANSPTGKPYVIVANEISGTITVFEIINNTLVSAVETINTNQNIVAYPNPATDHIFVKNVDFMTITNMVGKVVYQGQNQADGIKVDNLATGVYFIRDNYGRTCKFVVK
jgi:hypothetical protein